MTHWDRDSIHRKLQTIIAETRGVEEDECTLEARLFEDLAFESIDLIEVSFRVEEEWSGVIYSVDAVGEVLRHIQNGAHGEEVFSELRSQLKANLEIEMPETLPGVDPFNADVLQKAILGLFTVGSLVDFVEHRIAKRSA